MAMVFEELNSINVNEKTEKKKTGSTELTYLSWPWAWAEVKKRYPEASYEIVMHNGLPYVYDENTGYMVFTNVTIENVTHTMWLPVMDGANKAMKNIDYTYEVKNPSFKYAKLNKDDGNYYDNYGKLQTEFLTKNVAAASMFDINKTIMRCLVKNLAMFGLGLYIYAGEDLPESEAEEIKAAEEYAKKQLEKINAKDLKELKATLEKNEIKEETVLQAYKISSLNEVTYLKLENINRNLDKIKKMQEEKK